jgi:hypothetical protein
MSKRFYKGVRFEMKGDFCEVIDEMHLGSMDWIEFAWTDFSGITGKRILDVQSLESMYQNGDLVIIYTPIDDLKQLELDFESAYFKGMGPLDDLKKCICSSRDLFNYGCRCGCIKPYKIDY